MLNALSGIDFLTLFVLFKFVLVRSLASLSNLDLGPDRLPLEARASCSELNAKLDLNLTHIASQLPEARCSCDKWLELHEARTCLQLVSDMTCDSDMAWILRQHEQNLSHTVLDTLTSWLSS